MKGIENMKTEINPHGYDENPDKTKFEKLMKDMGVPANRVNGTSHNAWWFLRSAVVYMHHKHYFDAIDVAKKLAK